MDQIITFEKGFETRVEEYELVFDSLKILPVSELRKCWSLYLELILEKSGWQAIWKMPRKLCEEFNIAYPTAVLVHVNNIDFATLNAFVRIVGVQGDLYLPDFHEARLTKLWPVKQQNSEIDIFDIANALDMLKFYCCNILMPWDDQGSDGINDYNLKDRLRLYFDMKQGIIPNNNTSKYRCLLSEIQDTIDKLGYELLFYDNIEINSKSSEELINLSLKILELKTEAQLLQINLYKFHNKKIIEQPNYYWLVWQRAKLSYHIEFLQLIKNLTPESTKYKSATSLQNALNDAFTNDTIIIGPGQHYITYPGTLENGLCLKSASESKSKTVITTENEKSLVEFCGKKLTLENMTLDISNSQCGIIAHSGSILIKNCAIFSKDHLLSKHGIIALAGSEITLQDCHISGFNIGLYVGGGARVIMQNCNVSDVITAVKIFDNSALEMRNCNVHSTKYSLYLEPKYESKENIGNISILKKYPFIKILECNYENSDNNESPVIITNNNENIFSTSDNQSL